MAEILVGVIVSEISLETLSIQIFIGIPPIRAFWERIRNAPKDLRCSVDAVEIVKELLSQMNMIARSVKWSSQLRDPVIDLRSEEWKLGMTCQELSITRNSALQTRREWWFDLQRGEIMAIVSDASNNAIILKPPSHRALRYFELLYLYC